MGERVWQQRPPHTLTFVLLNSCVICQQRNNAKFRLEVIQSGLRGYEQQCDCADQGVTPLQSPHSFKREKKRQKASLTKTSWCRQANSVIRVPVTLDSKLDNTINRIFKKEALQLWLKTRDRDRSKIRPAVLCKLATHTSLELTYIFCNF